VRSTSRFIENLVRPLVVEDGDLEGAYREAANDEAAEAEAREWLDADLGDLLEVKSVG